MSQQAFHSKWGDIQGKSTQADEKSLYTEPGNEPATQRQLNLYYYYLFIREHLLKISAKDVIELGCGRGTISLFLAQYEKMQLTLMDNEEDAMQIAREAFADHGLEANFITGDALDTGIAENTFDATVSIGLAEHLDNVDELFAEQLRILKPGGVMISLNIPKKFSIQSLNSVYRLLLKLCGKYKESIRKDYYRNTFTASEYATFARKAGFENVSATYVCPFPIYVPLGMQWDKRITSLRKMLLVLRSIFLKYPYKTNSIAAQAHFVVAYKPQ